MRDLPSLWHWHKSLNREVTLGPSEQSRWLTAHRWPVGDTNNTPAREGPPLALPVGFYCTSNSPQRQCRVNIDLGTDKREGTLAWSPSPRYIRSHKADYMSYRFLLFFGKGLNDSKRGFPQIEIPLPPKGHRRQNAPTGRDVWVTRSTSWLKRMQAGVLGSKGSADGGAWFPSTGAASRSLPVLGMSQIFLPPRAGQKGRHVAASYFSEGSPA